MNIALGALIITILLLPGAVILKSYYTSFREKNKDLHITFTELLFRGIIFSFFVHLISVSIILGYGYDVDFQLLYKVVIGDKFVFKNSYLITSFIQFGIYNLVILLLTLVLTKFFKRFVLLLNLDLRYQGLRTSNFWFYIFSVRTLERSRSGEFETTDILFVDILTNQDIVYSGFLTEFEYNSIKEDLETLTLLGATKRTYLNSAESVNGKGDKEHALKHSAPRLINGDMFVILWKEVVNVNIYYIKLNRKKFNPPHNTTP